MAAAYRPNLKIYAVTNRKSTFTATAVLFGVVSRYLTFQHHSEVLDETIKLMLKK
jgi:pyruvate kinase